LIEHGLGAADPKVTRPVLDRFHGSGRQTWAMCKAMVIAYNPLEILKVHHKLTGWEIDNFRKKKLRFAKFNTLFDQGPKNKCTKFQNIWSRD